MGENVNIQVRAVDAFTRPMGSMTMALSSFIGKVGIAKMALIGLGGVAVIGAIKGLTASVKTATSFQHEMTKSMIMFNDVSIEMRGNAEALAVSMSKELGISANETAKAFWFLGSAGFSVNEALEALPITLKFARVNMLETGEATEFAMTLMKVYNVRTQDLEKTLDQTTFAMKSHMLSMQDMAESFAYVAPIAQSMGVEISELTSLVGALADAGIKGSMGGTVLRRSLINLTSPTGQAKEALKALNVSIYETDGSMRNILDVMADISIAMKDLSDQEKFMAMKAIFGARAIAGMSQLLNLGEDQLKEYANEVENATGEIENMWSSLKDDLSVQMEKTGAKINSLGITIGTDLITPLNKTVSVIGTVVEAFEEWYKSTKDVKNELGLLQLILPSFIASAMGVGRGKIGKPVLSEEEIAKEGAIAEEQERVNLLEVTASNLAGTNTLEDIRNSLLVSQQKALMEYMTSQQKEIELTKALDAVKGQDAFETFRLTGLLIDQKDTTSNLGNTARAVIPELDKLIMRIGALGGKTGKVGGGGGSQYWSNEGWRTMVQGQSYTTSSGDVVSWKKTGGGIAQDFISRPGQTPLTFSPQDTIMGVKNPSAMGTTVIVKDNNIYGTDPDEIANALQEKLATRMAI